MDFIEFKEKVTNYVNAGYPIIYINAYEELKMDALLLDVEKDTGRKMIEWNGADGLVDFHNKTGMVEGMSDLTQVLTYFNSMFEDLNDRILVLRDVSGYLTPDNKHIIALIKNICKRIIGRQIYATIVIVSSVVTIPTEIENFVTIFDMPPLDTNEIKESIITALADNELQVSDKQLEEMTFAFKGLTAYEISSLIDLSAAEEANASADILFEQKKQMIIRNNIVDMIDVNKNMDDIGGLRTIKSWLERKAAVFNDIDSAKEYGVKMPKGMLIVGVPGCGKSLTAKVTAKLFHVPLLKLDMGRIMGKYLGESEKNMRKAIEIAENISPCVLWIDELEKGFAGTDGTGHEVTMRLLGTFLTWLQDKESPVYVVATANNISKMPPELLRKGRFDEIFYVDLPNMEERKSIFEIHIKKMRPQDLQTINLEQLANKTEGFSGAEIESVIVESVETAFANREKGITTKLLEEAISTISPMSKSMKEKMDELKNFYKSSNFKCAT